MKTKNLYLIVGKSGSGKTTVVNELERKSFPVVESYTTRPPRYEGEKGHIFVSKEQFDAMTMIAYTKFNGFEYGVTKELLGQNSFYVIDPPGVDYLRNHYNDRRLVVIYLDTTASTRRNRMFARGDSKSMVDSRIENDRRMFYGATKKADHVIDANRRSISEITDLVLQIVIAEELASKEERK